MATVRVTITVRSKVSGGMLSTSTVAYHKDGEFSDLDLLKIVKESMHLEKRAVSELLEVETRIEKE